MFKSTKKAYVYFQPEQSPDSTDNRDEERVDDHQLCLFVMWNDATIAEYVASTCPRNIFEYTVEIRQETIVLWNCYLKTRKISCGIFFQHRYLMDFRPCFSHHQTCFHFSPPTEASIKSFIYHSVPDILDSDSSRTDLREHAPMTSGFFFNFWTPCQGNSCNIPYLIYFWGPPSQCRRHLSIAPPVPTDWPRPRPTLPKRCRSWGPSQCTRAITASGRSRTRRINTSPGTVEIGYKLTFKFPRRYTNFRGGLDNWVIIYVWIAKNYSRKYQSGVRDKRDRIMPRRIGLQGLGVHAFKRCWLGEFRTHSIWDIFVRNKTKLMKREQRFQNDHIQLGQFNTCASAHGKATLHSCTNILIFICTLYRSTEAATIFIFETNGSFFIHLSSQPRSSVTTFDDTAEVVAWTTYHAHGQAHGVRWDDEAHPASVLAFFIAPCHDVMLHVSSTWIWRRDTQICRWAPFLEIR